MKRVRDTHDEELDKTVQELRRLTDKIVSITRSARSREQELARKDVEISELACRLEKSRDQVVNKLPRKGTTRLVCGHCPIFIDVDINKWDGSDSRFAYDWEFERGWRCGGCS